MRFWWILVVATVFAHPEEDRKSLESASSPSKLEGPVPSSARAGRRRRRGRLTTPLPKVTLVNSLSSVMIPTEMQNTPSKDHFPINLLIGNNRDILFTTELLDHLFQPSM